MHFSEISFVLKNNKLITNVKKISMLYLI